MCFNYIELPFVKGAFMKSKVLLILVDGMRPDAIPLCGDDGRLEEIYKEGAYTFAGRTAIPPVTLPCHMSLFHSVDPDRHGVTTNTFVPQNHPVTGLVEWLSLFGKSSAFFYTWEQLRDLCTPGKHLSFAWFKSQGYFEFPQLEHEETDACIEYLNQEGPDFAFLYLGGTDEFGHRNGWMSPEYLEEIKDVSGCIGRVLGSIPEEYSVIITADHGGHGRNHGDDIPEDMTIPVTFRGPGFEKGKQLGTVSIKDIAPTVADILNIPVRRDWEGKSVYSK